MTTVDGIVGTPACPQSSESAQSNSNFHNRRNETTRQTAIPNDTVAEYLRRAALVGTTWPVPSGFADIALERTLFSLPFTSEPARP